MGNQDGVQGPSLGDIVASLSRRLDVLERTQPTGSMPKMVDLADWGGRVAPTAGQAPLWNNTYKRWVPGSAGIQGDYADFRCTTQSIPGTGVATNIVFNSTLDGAGTSITVSSGTVQLVTAGIYIYFLNVRYPQNTPGYAATSSLAASTSGSGYSYFSQDKSADGVPLHHAMSQFGVSTGGDHIIATALQSSGGALSIAADISVLRLA